jgi:hypothetical protein
MKKLARGDRQSWSSYDRTWVSGPDKQEVFILTGHPALTPDNPDSTQLNSTFSSTYRPSITTAKVVNLLREGFLVGNRRGFKLKKRHKF